MVENKFCQSVQNPVEKKKKKKKGDCKALGAKAQTQKTREAIAKLFALNVNAINRLRKEINRLLGNVMSNINLKVTVEEKTDVLKFRFSRFKKFVTRSVLGSSNSSRYH